MSLPKNLGELLADHERWLSTNGREGARLDLRGADLRNIDLAGKDLSRSYLSGADLHGADLSWARLQGTDFRNSILSGVRLKEADLYEADLSRAQLREADLQGANLSQARLWDADLQDAELTGAKGLAGHQLGGSNLCRAKLGGDAEMLNSQRLTLVEELTKNAGKLFVTLLLMGLFAQLTVAQTQDADLFTNQGTAKLPVVNADVRVVQFYLLMPAVLLCAYAYFHVYLQRLWEALAQLPAVFPDGDTLDRKTYPWLPNELVHEHFHQLRRDRRPLSRLQQRLTAFLVWWLIPLSLLPFWAQYLVRRQPHITLYLIACLMVALCMGLMFSHLSKMTLSGENRDFSYGSIRPPNRGVSVRLGASVVAGAGLIGLSIAAFHGVPEEAEGNAAVAAVSPLQRWMPIVLDRCGFPPFAQLYQADLSSKPSGWKGSSPEDVFPVKGAVLTGADLRYAKATGAFLVNADVDRAELRGANLVGADLRRGWLRESNYMGANMEGAILVGADLYKAHMCQINLRGANLSDTHLEKQYPHGGAYLGEAKLVAAILVDAKLQGTNLRGADLRGADLRRAKLCRADLRDTDPERGPPLNTDLRGADLRDADLSSAHLDGARLEGAYYSKEGTKWPPGFTPSASLLRSLPSQAVLQGRELRYPLTVQTECGWCAE